MSLVTSMKSGLYSVKNTISDNKAPILLIGGNVLSLAGFLLGIRAGGKIDRELGIRKDSIKEFKDIYDNYEGEDPLDTYDAEAFKKDKMRTNKRCIIEVAKAAGPAVGLYAVGQFCENKAYCVMHKNYKNAVAWGAGILGSFMAYRKNVRDEFGEEMDNHFLYGTSLKEKNVTLVTKDENGNEVETKEKLPVIENLSGASYLAMWWTPDTTNKYQPDEYYFLNFARTTEKYFNDILAIKKKINVNEIKDYLGAKPDQLTLKGLAAGWREGDIIKIKTIKAARPLGNGKYEPTWIVDFNAHYILDEFPDADFVDDDFGDDLSIELPEV